VPISYVVTSTGSATDGSSANCPAAIASLGGNTSVVARRLSFQTPRVALRSGAVRQVRRGSEHRGDVLIVTGPAAAGKTTAARRLAEESSEPSVHLQADDFFHALKKGRLRGWVDGAEPQHEVVFEAVASAASAYAAGGYFVVVDSLIRPRFLPIVIENIKLKGIDLHYVVLRPRFAETLARSGGRRAEERHDDAVLEHMYAYFESLGELEGHVIDNSEHDMTLTVDTIRAMLRSGAARL
jgi:chloramphenicol 3-O-phosphotransferase